MSEIPDSMYRGIAEILAQSQATGSPVVLIAVNREERSEVIVEGLEFHAASHSSYEGQGMVLKLARMIEAGSFDISDEAAEEFLEGGENG